MALLNESVSGKAGGRSAGRRMLRDWIRAGWVVVLEGVWDGTGEVAVFEPSSNDDSGESLLSRGTGAEIMALSFDFESRCSAWKGVADDAVVDASAEESAEC